MLPELMRSEWECLWKTNWRELLRKNISSPCLLTHFDDPMINIPPALKIAATEIEEAKKYITPFLLLRRARYLLNPSEEVKENHILSGEFPIKSPTLAANPWKEGGNYLINENKRILLCSQITSNNKVHTRYIYIYIYYIYLDIY